MSPEASDPPSARVFGVVAGALLFALLLWRVGDLLNPFLLFWALLAVLLPFRRTAAFLPVIGTAGVLTALWLLSEMGFLLAPFVLSGVLAYILNPAVGWLSRRRFLSRFRGDAAGAADAQGAGGAGDTGAAGAHGAARSIAIGILALPVLAVTAALGIWGGPYLLSELNDLVGRAPAVIDRLANLTAELEEWLVRLRFPGVDGSDWVARLREIDGEAVVTFLQQRSAGVGDTIWQGVLGFGKGIATVLTLLGYVVLAPVVTFYLLRDWEHFIARVDGLIPARNESLREAAREYDHLLAGYMRGQLLVSVTVGALTTLGLWIVGFPYAILLGTIVAIFSVVPYLGLILSLIPALLIAFASGSVGLSLVKVLGVYGVAQSLESGVISPKIVGDSTGLHPVWILFAIMAGGFFFGFAGLLLAVPVAVGVKLLVIRMHARYRDSAYFRGS